MDISLLMDTNTEAVHKKAARNRKKKRNGPRANVKKIRRHDGVRVQNKSKITKTGYYF